jgi:hypothetical protein
MKALWAFIKESALQRNAQSYLLVCRIDFLCFAKNLATQLGSYDHIKHFFLSNSFEEGLLLHFLASTLAGLGMNHFLSFSN